MEVISQGIDRMQSQWLRSDVGAVSCLHMHALKKMHLHQIKDKKKKKQNNKDRAQEVCLM